jgi:hypothetical protein
LIFTTIDEAGNILKEHFTQQTNQLFASRYARRLPVR